MLSDILRNFDLPNLQKVIFIGHSAGGQMVNRYAAASLYEAAGTTIQYIVSNPSSYLYLSEKRLTENNDYEFETPDQNTLNQCPEYNEWRYGLDELYSYMTETGAQQLRENYRTRDVVVLIGGDDNDPNDSSLGISCSAMLQGPQRLARSIIYAHHLADEFGETPHPFAILEGVGHSSNQVFQAECGQFFLFDVDTDDPCDLSSYHAD